MSFAREAWPLVLPPLLVGITALAWGVKAGSIGLMSCGVLLIVLAIATLLFFRDPDRTPPSDVLAVVAPADGVVVQSETLQSGEKLVAIFLSVFDVHVNRSPFAGTVSKVTTRPGTYLHANSQEGIAGNERVEVELTTKFGTLRFSQLSGLVARKISCRVKAGDKLATGERFGLIYFGSRMEVVMPAEATIIIQVGERTAAGETVIGRFSAVQ